MTGALILVLHGVGGRGAHLQALADLVAPGLPGATFRCPDAPHPYDWDPAGRQWFSTRDITPRNRPARLRAARAAFDRVLHDEIAAAGFADQPDRVALIGFSQGAIMAVDAVMTGRWRPAALAALSGRLVKSGPVDPQGVPVMLSHGLDDPVIPPEDAQRAAAHWRRQGCAVDLHLWAGLPHWFDARVAETTAAFLRRALAVTA
ncbi:alpha/beta hydrolase [Gemmobacter caeruleus]|uniref:alpha/beta hydrolase n=1 Tax=Gemmobacter caeruleus TaxID=2595004 RepID=UPI0011EED6A7|nr:dienelactone hydrolase family protein [Gemmobacter caeruleus]